MPTADECKKMLFNFGIALGVPPRLISERLLSDLDKYDMMQGVVTIDELRASVEAWRDNGMPDYAHGNTETYEAEKKRREYEKSSTKTDGQQGPAFRKPFIDYD